ncbi:hypothetical protein ACQ86N_27445 [Puia sp. P3]|uniref:hypothetical protein n=1 Tax=Puia sp. P3 TaxID=3423952 RepID=UPI003D66989F
MRNSEPFVLKSDNGIQIISWLDKETFERLAQHHDGPCVTIYLPTHNSGVEVNGQEDKKAFKSVLQKVQQSLIQQKFDASLAGQLLIPGLQLLRQRRVLAQPIPRPRRLPSPGYSACCRLPTSPDEKTHINSGFQLTPLASILTDTDYAYLLVLSKHAARLYRADRFTLARIDVPEMPIGMDDVIQLRRKGQKRPYPRNRLQLPQHKRKR